MEEVQDINDTYSHKKHFKKKTLRKKGQASEVGKIRSLPGMYLVNDSMLASSSSGANILPSQPRDNQCNLDAHKLERLSCRYTEPHELDLPHINKPMENKPVSDTAQSCNIDDFELFPPLGTQSQTKLGKGPVSGKKHRKQHEEVKVGDDDSQEKLIKVNSPQSKTKECFKTLEGEHAIEFNTSNFGNTEQEKVSSSQVIDGRETIASFNEFSKPRLASQNNIGLYKSVIEQNACAVGVESFFRTVQETDGNEAFKEHRKYTNADKTTGELDTHDTYSDNGLENSTSAPEPILAKNDVSDSRGCTEELSSSSEKDPTSSRRNIISYLKMLLQNHELQSLSMSGKASEAKVVNSSEGPSADDSLTEQDTAYVGKTCMSDEKLTSEEEKACEEILDHYIVLSKLPSDLTRDDILHHISKVGIVTYCIMDGSRAHVIFLRAEDADTAFGLRHELCGEELVVYRPRRPLCTLHLSGLTNNTPNEEVINVVSQYGVLINFYRPLHKITSSLAGYCFIKVDKKVAEGILRENSLLVNNVRIFAEVSSLSEVKLSSNVASTQQAKSVQSSPHAPHSLEGYKLMLTDVPEMASYDTIKEHFQKFGKLLKVFLRNRKGFVIFASQDSLERALATRHIILGMEVNVSHGSFHSRETERRHY